MRSRSRRTSALWAGVVAAGWLTIAATATGCQGSGSGVAAGTGGSGAAGRGGSGGAGTGGSGGEAAASGGRSGSGGGGGSSSGGGGGSGAGTDGGAGSGSGGAGSGGRVDAGAGSGGRVDASAGSGGANAGTGGAGTGGAGTGGRSSGSGGSAGAGGVSGCQPPATYNSLFADLLNRTATEVDNKVNAAFTSLFHGGSSATVYYEVGTDQAYMLDVANDDVRSEGMSYGMMIAVQLDKKAEFDRIWRWAKQYMFYSSGPMAGTFAWHRTTAGAPIGTTTNPAPDGEEYIATALIFASKRWGDGTGILDYAGEARALLDVMIHKGETPEAQAGGVTSMFHPDAKLVVFVPNGNSASSTFTDPSYVMPAFSDIWACFDAKNSAFWRTVSATSRAFFPKATHPTTGLAPEYSAFDGTPSTLMDKGDFRFDAWRVVMNVMADHHYRKVDPWQTTYAARLGAFFTTQGRYGDQYTLAGTALSSDHSSGLVAVNATLGFALPPADGRRFVQELWDLAVPTGQYRYYNGLLYMLALLHASGKFRLWF